MSAWFELKCSHLKENQCTSEIGAALTPRQGQPQTGKPACHGRHSRPSINLRALTAICCYWRSISVSSKSTGSASSRFPRSLFMNTVFNMAEQHTYSCLHKFIWVKQSIDRLWDRSISKYRWLYKLWLPTKFSMWHYSPSVHYFSIYRAMMRNKVLNSEILEVLPNVAVLQKRTVWSRCRQHFEEENALILL